MEREAISLRRPEAYVLCAFEDCRFWGMAGSDRFLKYQGRGDHDLIRFPLRSDLGVVGRGNRPGPFIRISLEAADAFRRIRVQLSGLWWAENVGL